jgi:maleylacetoacetate isomerase
MKLYDYWRSSAAYRVRIGLNLKGLDYETTTINLMAAKDERLGDEYAVKNPQGRVPAIEAEAGVLNQSLAILAYLDEIHPEPPLLPRDPWARAQVRAFALTIACDIHPLNNLSVLNRLKDQFAASEAAVSEWYRHWICVSFAALETQAEKRAKTHFTFADEPTLADICLVPQMYNARRFKTNLSLFPNLCIVDERARAHPAFAKAAPENQPEASKQAAKP